MSLWKQILGQPDREEVIDDGLSDIKRTVGRIEKSLRRTDALTRLALIVGVLALVITALGVVAAAAR